MLWFFPLAILIGFLGTQTALRSRHTLKARKKEPAWWLLGVLSWLPMACWIVSQFVRQD
jgi:hypothetical protein